MVLVSQHFVLILMLLHDCFIEQYTMQYDHFPIV